MNNEATKKINKKKLFEEFYNFFENPDKVTFRELIKTNVGELKTIDFKENLPENSTLARSILAMANYEGGCLVIGIKQKEDNSLTPKGLEKLTDKADITKGIKKYLPSKTLESIEILDFSYEDSEYKKLAGKKFQIIFIFYKPEYLPHVSRAGGKGIKEDTIYIRRDTEAAPVNYDELQDIINRRVETKYSSSRELNLKKHLEQLKTLYEEIPETISYPPFFANLMTRVIPKELLGEEKANPEYPKESYNEFILKMIREKKSIITKELGFRNIES